MLIKEEQQRYQRQMLLPEFGLEGQEKLKAAKVLVIGAGGLGCPVLQYLAAAGVGEIGIVDDDVVELSNLHRQILFNAADIGLSKATVACAKLKLLNPHLSLNSYVQRFDATCAKDICSPYNLVVDCSDNFDTRYLVNDTCVALGKTLVFGSILRFEGQIAVFNHNGGVNYRDLYPEPPSEDISCADGGVIGTLPGLIGLYMANETIKLICEVGQTLADKLMSVDLLNNTSYVFSIKADTTATNNKPTQIKNEPPIKEIDRQTLTTWLETKPKEVCLIDVREAYEHEEHNIGGMHISLYDLNNAIDRIPAGRQVVCYCQTGQKSKMAAKLLQPYYNGEVYSLKGGV
ncbi:thiamine biosynthesis protein ThiF [Pedobacter sp. HDW13]|uniref:HesA/MoeB/ThiF family protein n=1 Tax=unclassified Pedobacter TaxID=2628915 RepID=UPI000F5AA862|nr:MULTISPECIES: HesA/MoeB/ThiF family protein [unclassified Pedobacter]QIL39378.1 thiamine biosynthesis protein ThiF [Pedobacter sp. HDW13]RQO71021.1 thiamine biosynthesis protein ThiF [Pedobacter sp. KBW01]